MKTKAQLDAANQFESYRKGWITGAKTSATDQAFTEHADVRIRDAYNLGYKHGQVARDASAKFAQSKYGHTPNILRLQGEHDGEQI